LEADEMSRRATLQRDAAQRGQSSYLAELARQRFGEGNLVRSLLYALEALPDKRQNLERPELRQAKEMLVQSYHQILAQDSPIWLGKKIAFFAFVSDKNWLVSTSHDGTARIWDQNGQLMRALRGRIGSITGASISSDGKFIATASSDGMVQIWELDSGNPIT